MTYDTTLIETLEEKVPHGGELPACLRRDRLTSPYFPQLTREQLALVILLASLLLATGFSRVPLRAWGDLTLGRWIVTHGALPAVDPLSAAVDAQVPLYCEWLSQVLAYQTVAVAGLDGLLAARSLLVVLAGAALVGAVRLRRVPLCWAISAAVGAMLIALPLAGSVTPALVGLLGVSLVLIAASQLPERRHPLVWLPLAMAMWANLHESFALGLALLVAYAAGATWRICGELRSAKAVATDVRTARLWAAVGLSIAAASINPYGPALMIKVLPYLKASSATLTSMYGLMLLVTAAVAIAVFKTSPRRWETSDLLLMLMAGLAAIASPDLVPYYALVWAWGITPYAVALWEARFGERTAAPPAAMNTVLAMGFVFMALLMTPATNHVILGQPRGIAAVAEPGTPFYLADEIARCQLRGNLFAPAAWGDYLVWMQPDSLRPLVASHARRVPTALLSDYRLIASGSSGWQAAADRHQIRYLAISRRENRALAKGMQAYASRPQSRARILYQDQQALLVELLPPAPAK